MLTFPPIPTEGGSYRAVPEARDSLQLSVSLLCLARRPDHDEDGCERSRDAMPDGRRSYGTDGLKIDPFPQH